MLANPHDKPILSDLTLTVDRLKIEQRFAQILPTDLIIATKSVDSKAVKKIIKKVVADNCWGLWLAGMKHGSDHAMRELKLIGYDLNRTANFASALVTEDPPSKLQNKRAETAIWTRSNTLAGNVADTEWARIQAALNENVAGDSDRTALVAAIANTLGGERFTIRARAIARTELTAAYNTGRIETYKANGVGEIVRYCIRDERTCPQCAGMNGLVARLDDIGAVARLQPPSHTNCRCTVTPRIDINALAAQNRQVPPEAKAGWAIADIIKGVLG